MKLPLRIESYKGVDSFDVYDSEDNCLIENLDKSEAEEIVKRVNGYEDLKSKYHILKDNGQSDMVQIINLTEYIDELEKHHDKVVENMKVELYDSEKENEHLKAAVIDRTDEINRAYRECDSLKLQTRELVKNTNYLIAVAKDYNCYLSSVPQSEGFDETTDWIKEVISDTRDLLNKIEKVR